MKDSIKGPKVENVFIAAVQEPGKDGTDVFNIYIINKKNKTIEGVLVSSVGYLINKKNGEKTQTSMLRHSLETIDPASFKKIEPIMENVFGLNNEYWVSFWIDNIMYDKKFIFLPETIKEENFTEIPVIRKKGVLIE
jgi:hypothetical protein